MLLERWGGRCRARRRLGICGGSDGRAVYAVSMASVRFDDITDPESSAVGYSNGKIREDGHQSVRQGGFEGQVVGDFMDGEKEILVRGCTNDVGRQDETKREDW